MWPSSGRTPTAPCVSCTEDSTSGCSTPDKVSLFRAEGQDHLPHPADHAALDAAQDTVGFRAARAQCWLMSIYHPPGPFQQGCASSSHSPACNDSGSCLNPDADLALGFVESHKVHLVPLLKLHLAIQHLQVGYQLSNHLVVRDNSVSAVYQNYYTIIRTGTCMGREIRSKLFIDLH